MEKNYLLYSLFSLLVKFEIQLRIQFLAIYLYNCALVVTVLRSAAAVVGASTLYSDDCFDVVFD